MERLTSEDGEWTVEVEWPAPDGKRPVVLLSYHKAGSVLLNGLCAALCQRFRRPKMDLERDLFNHGVNILSFANDLRDRFRFEGVVNGVHRAFLDAFETDRCKDARFVVLIRNPLDVAVSYYFSMRQSHHVPSKGELRDGLLAHRSEIQALTLDEAALGLQVEYLFRNMARFGRFLKSGGARDIRLYRYEDVIFQKRRWISSLCRDLQVPLDVRFCEKVLAEWDVVPEAENEHSHVRQVKPGDHLRKLSRETQAVLRERHAEVFRDLGYA